MQIIPTLKQLWIRIDMDEADADQQMDTYEADADQQMTQEESNYN